VPPRRKKKEYALTLPYPIGNGRGSVVGGLGSRACAALRPGLQLSRPVGTSERNGGGAPQANGAPASRDGFEFVAQPNDLSHRDEVGKKNRHF
jgi:hypothetical protein